MTTAETLAVSLERHVEVREPIASVLYLGATARSERRVQKPLARHTQATPDSRISPDA